MLLFNNLCTGYGMRMWLSLVLAWHVEGVGINTLGIDVDTNDIHKIGRSSKDKWNKLPLIQSAYTPGHPGCPRLSPPSTPGTKVGKCELTPRSCSPRTRTTTTNTASNAAQSPVGPAVFWESTVPAVFFLYTCTAPLRAVPTPSLFAASDMLQGARDSKGLQPRLWQWVTYKWKRWRRVTEARLAGAEKEPVDKERTSWMKQWLSSPLKPGRN